MTPQDAKLALDLISRVNIPASDDAIGSVAKVRASLHRIASGYCVVVEPPKVEPVEPAK
jgi:hypothetical protein